jgi:4-hydroxythreonine-4-phosphate dehydrogenase
VLTWHLREAINYLKDGKIDALVTAPINKKNIQRDDFHFVGHTDFITEELGAKDNLMLMVSEELRVGVATAHIPLSEVSNTLTKEVIESKLKIFIKTLKSDFGITKPKLLYWASIHMPAKMASWARKKLK